MSALAKQLPPSNAPPVSQYQPLKVGIYSPTGELMNVVELPDPRLAYIAAFNSLNIRYVARMEGGES